MKFKEADQGISLSANIDHFASKERSQSPCSAESDDQTASSCDEEEEISLVAGLFDSEDDRFGLDTDVTIDLHPVDNDQSDNDAAPPAYLMRAILAGLYELPPPHILKCQLGLGRRVRYDSVHRLPSDFVLASTGLEVLTLTRHGLEDMSADFDIYRRQSVMSHSRVEKLRQIAHYEQEVHPYGLDVSNAGGAWHGPPNFLQSSDPIRQELYQMIVDTVRSIDENAETLDLEPEAIECWLNNSWSGSWNRLHTHEGSAWSGVFYVDVGADQVQEWGGRLVLKPTPHSREVSYGLNSVELDRFRNHRHHDFDGTCGEYIDLPTLGNSLVVFPGWLHHCVLPSKLTDDTRPRISIAFNINWKS